MDQKLKNEYGFAADSDEKELFTIEEPEFDMSNFKGRFNCYLKASNPRYAFFSNDKIREFQRNIVEQKEREKL